MVLYRGQSSAKSLTGVCDSVVIIMDVKHFVLA